jgi:hypothetical protein
MVFLLLLVLSGCYGVKTGGDSGETIDTDVERVGFLDSSDIESVEAVDCEPTTEVCDGLDNDCDGIIDDGVVTDAPTWYADNDGDGFGDSASTTTACTQPDGYVNVVGDCNDNDPTVFTGAPELCDGLDNDCDDVVDDNCVGFFVGRLLTSGR